jgi:biopolymer transport protein ExbD
MRFYTRSKRPLTINVVSLIDILTILLIFFIVTTQFKKAEPEVQIKLPESSTATEEQRSEEPVIIHASKDQKIFLGDREIPLPALAAELQKIKASAKSPVFALKADEGVPLGFFVKVLDASKEAGLADLSLFTEPAKQP